MFKKRESRQQMIDIKELAREASAKLIPHTTSVHNVDVIRDAILKARELDAQTGIDQMLTAGALALMVGADRERACELVRSYWDKTGCLEELLSKIREV
jgi:hypothetical protein